MERIRPKVGDHPTPPPSVGGAARGETLEMALGDANKNFRAKIHPDFPLELGRCPLNQVLITLSYPEQVVPYADPTFLNSPNSAPPPF